MSIMDMFKSAPAQPVVPAANPNAATPGNIPVTAANPASATNTNVPADSIGTNGEDNPLSQLDQFKTLWETDPNAKAPVDTSIFAKVTPESMQTAAKKNDFSKVATPELMAKINAGGPEATQALMEVMNSMAQKGFGDSAFASTKLIEQALAKQQENFMKALPGIIKSQTVSENLRTSNPVFNHPAAAPILDMFKKQLLVKNPNASASELQDMASSYLESFASAATPQKQTAAQKASASEVNWDDFLQ